MKLRQCLSLCYHYDSNIKHVKIIAITGEAKKYISNGGQMLLSSITAPIQSIYEDESLSDFEVSEMGIENDTTIFFKIC